MHFKLQNSNNQYGLAVNRALLGKGSELVPWLPHCFNKRGKDYPMSHSLHSFSLKKFSKRGGVKEELLLAEESHLASNTRALLREPHE